MSHMRSALCRSRFQLVALWRDVESCIEMKDVGGLRGVCLGVYRFVSMGNES